MASLLLVALGWRRSSAAAREESMPSNGRHIAGSLDIRISRPTKPLPVEEEESMKERQKPRGESKA
jgi:hypothetical protein